MGHKNPARQPTPDSETHHGIQTEESHVGEVLTGEGLIIEVGVDTPQTPEPIGSHPVVGQVRNEDGGVVSQDNVMHMPSSVHQKGHLPVEIPGYLGQRTGNFGRYKSRRRYPPAVETLQSLSLPGCQTPEIAVNLDAPTPPPR